MKQNDFKTDTSLCARKLFTKKLRVVLLVSIILTGIVSFFGLVALTQGIVREVWKTTAIASIGYQGMRYLCVFCAFIGLLNLRLQKKHLYTKILVISIRSMACIIVLGAFIIPRLPGYQSSGLEILSRGTFVTIDGWILLPGLFLLVVSVLLKEGFHMQKELEEIL